MKEEENERQFSEEEETFTQIADKKRLMVEVHHYAKKGSESGVYYVKACGGASIKY